MTSFSFPRSFSRSTRPTPRTIDRSGERGAVHPGLAAVILLGAAIGVFILKPDAFLPEGAFPGLGPVSLSKPSAPDVPDGPEERAREEEADRSEAARAQTADPKTAEASEAAGAVEEPETETPVLSSLFHYVREEAKKIDLATPVGRLTAGMQAASEREEARQARIERFRDGAPRSVPAVGLGPAWRLSDAMMRWERLSLQFPDLAELEPVLIKTRVWAVWPSLELVALGAPAEAAQEMCRHVAASGAHCEARSVNTGTIDRFLEEPNSSES